MSSMQRVNALCCIEACFSFQSFQRCRQITCRFKNDAKSCAQGELPYFRAQNVINVRGHAEHKNIHVMFYILNFHF